MKGFQPPPRFGGAQLSREPVEITRSITVTEGISVKDLAEKLDVRGKDLIATLLMKGVFVTVNQSLEGELVKDVARAFGADAIVICSGRAAGEQRRSKASWKIRRGWSRLFGRRW